MSWSVTIKDIQNYDRLSDPKWLENAAYFASQHPLYVQDMERAFELARNTGLASAVITGGRTPSPYGDDEVVDISIRGTMTAEDYQAAIRRFIEAGPDVESG